MNSLVYYSSSEEEDEQQRPKKQIKLDKIVDFEYKSKVRNTQNESLLKSLPKPTQSTENHSTKRADNQLNMKQMTVTQVAAKPLESVESDEDFEFFSLPKSEESKPKPQLGPMKPSHLPSETISTPILLPPPHDQQDPIQYKTVIRKDQLGDAYEMERQKKKYEIPTVLDTAFANIDTEFIPTTGDNRNNSILVLAREAKLRSAEHLEQKAARTAAVKAARAKYGFR